MNPGPWGILIVVIAVLLLFGRGKISGMMGEVASGIRAFQKGLKDDDNKPMAQQIDGEAEAEPAKKKSKEA